MSDSIILDVEDNVGNGVSLYAIWNDYESLGPIGPTLRIEVHSDWSGDSETGFGFECSKYLTRPEVKKMISAMTAWLGETVEH